MKRKACLSLTNINKTLPSLDRPIIDHLSFEVDKEDFVIVLGQNGSGKSSLIKLINGLERPDCGDIVLQGQNCKSLSFERLSKQICTLTQDLSLSTFGNLTVFENCLLADRKKPRERKGIEKTGKERFRSHLHLFNQRLADKFDVPVRRLSGGERQVLALAMCLLHPPTLLLLDEHTSALDPVMARNVMALTRQFVEKGQITTLMTTHNLEYALQYGNRLIAIDRGKIIFEADKEQKARMTRDELLRKCYTSAH